MHSPKCLRCGTASDTTRSGGLCLTCRSESDATTPVRPFISTLTLNPQLEGTRFPVSGLAPEVLPSGGYRYEELLGEGGMGVVWRAVQVSTERTVAVKKIQPDCYTPSGLRRFVAEARALAVVEHENVVRLYDFVPDPADPFLVMEFVPGPPLSKRIKEGGPLPPSRAAEVISAAARGVQAVHDAGVIHRDLKPANLLLTPDGTIKVVDFGLGKQLDSTEGVTRHGVLIGGTPGFMAPEQVDDRLGETGRPADVWGLGACLYAALTGRAPFPSEKSSTHRVLCDPVIPPRDKNQRIPPELDAIVVKCLAKNPADRYPSAAELADDLDRFRRGESTVARPQPWVMKTLRKLRSPRTGLIIGWAVAILALTVGVGASLLARRPPVDPEAELQRKFLNHEEVTLVPKVGPPVHHKWILGRSDITDSPGEDGAAYLSPSPGKNAVELFRPPGDSYRVSVDLQHREALDETSYLSQVGLILFHERFADHTSHVDRVMTVVYADYDAAKWNSKPSVPGQVDVDWRYLIHQGNTQGPATGTWPQRRGDLKFAIGPRLPGKWRRLIAEVSPEGLRLLWVSDADDPDAEPVQVGWYAAADLNKNCRRHAEQETRVAHVNPTPTWNPVGGIGLWAERSGLAFRSVTVRANPLPTQTRP